jgi:hypothetical protein
MSFMFAKSLQCLLIFSIAARGGLDQHAINGDACNPLIDEDCTPTDMTFSVISSIKISSKDFSTMLRSLDIHARDQISRVGGKILKVRRTGGKVSIRTVR